MFFQAVSEQIFNEHFLFLNQMAFDKWNCENNYESHSLFKDEIMGSSYSFSLTDTFWTH